MYNLADDLVHRHLRNGQGNRLAVLYEGLRLTYRDLAELVSHVGDALTTLGVGTGQRVLLVLFDSPEFIASFLGAARIGAVGSPTNTSLRRGDYKYFLEESQAAIVVVHKLWEQAPPG
jgi:acyl-coenzyme A synthetase/AMP-(fatty) acid ligase